MRSPNRFSKVSLGLVASMLAACSSTPTQEAPSPEPASSLNTTPFAGEVGMGVSYLQTRGADLTGAVHAMVAALDNRDLEAARAAYFDARAAYEEIEVVSPAFPELDHRIDARTYEFPDGELSPEFGGFHRIEIFLFSRFKTAPALPYAKQLLEDVEELETVLADRSRYGATMSFEAMIDRCTEIAARTITSEEETWSDQSLLAIRHAWIGIHSQYRHFAGDVRDVDVKIAERLNRAYRSALEVIAEDFPIGQVEGTPYSLIDRDKRREIADVTLKLRGYLVQAQEALDLVDA